jgi:hypothetical protein
VELNQKNIIIPDGFSEAAESNGELALYFGDNDPQKLPDEKALARQKAACLIWWMAGGAEPEEYYYS